MCRSHERDFYLQAKTARKLWGSCVSILKWCRGNEQCRIRNT